MTLKSILVNHRKAFSRIYGKVHQEKFIDYSERRPIINSDELEILTELQHYGGKTNLIDFTTDYLIAIFFACDSHPTKDGRVILLEKTELIEKTMIVRPQDPQHRVIAQKSIFLYPPDGVIDVPDDNIVYIPAYLKQRLLEFLRKYTIYLQKPSTMTSTVLLEIRTSIRKLLRNFI